MAVSPFFPEVPDHSGAKFLCVPLFLISQRLCLFFFQAALENFPPFPSENGYYSEFGLSSVHLLLNQASRPLLLKSNAPCYPPPPPFLHCPKFAPFLLKTPTPPPRSGTFGLALFLYRSLSSTGEALFFTFPLLGSYPLGFLSTTNSPYRLDFSRAFFLETPPSPPFHFERILLPPLQLSAAPFSGSECVLFFPGPPPCCGPSASIFRPLFLFRLLIWFCLGKLDSPFFVQSKSGPWDRYPSPIFET